jgi:hypothetical protein
MCSYCRSQIVSGTKQSPTQLNKVKWPTACLNGTAVNETVMSNIQHNKLQHIADPKLHEIYRNMYPYQPFLTWGPRNPKGPMNRFQGGREIGLGGGGGQIKLDLH